MTEIVVKILVELLSTLALATQQVKQGRLSMSYSSFMQPYIIPHSMSLEKLGKKLLGEKETEAVLERLDRLNHEEARTVAAQTLEIVYGLVKNMKLVMDGAWHVPAYDPLYPECLSHRRKNINRRYPTRPRYVSFALRYLRLLNFGISCDAAHCKQHQQVPAFVAVYVPISHSLIRCRLQVISD